MASYNKTVDFLAKDSLLTGNPAKKVKGSEIDTEFNNIATADADNVKSSALGSGVGTFLATPSSANLAAAVTGETGSGALVFATSPTLVTPALGTPASGTLTNCTGLPPATGLSSVTGTGAAVLATSPILVTPALGTPASGNLSNCTGYPITSVLSASYDSGDQTISSGGGLSLTHSLGAKPKLVQFYAKCLTAENDYSIGDEIQLGGPGIVFVGAGSSACGGFVSVADATTVTVRFGNGAANPIAALHKTSGALSTLTNANWAFVVRAYT